MEPTADDQCEERHSVSGTRCTRKAGHHGPHSAIPGYDEQKEPDTQSRDDAGPDRATHG